MNEAEKEPDYKAMREQLIAANKLTVEAVFVPWKQSRNKNEKDPSLNWKVTLKRDGKSVITTDYMQGIGHVPNYKHGERSVWYNDYILEVVEKGKHAKNIKMYENYGNFVNTPLPSPSVEDILYCLISDADVLEHSSYEDWASSLGYDEDSRKGEKIYNECIQIALKLRAGLGNTLVEQLREAFTDY